MKPDLLLVEDDPATYRAMRSLLRHDFHVLHAATIDRALALLDPLPSVVILDLMLGDEDGLRVLQHIRERGLPVRVVITTGIPDGPHMDAVLALEPDAVLRKRYEPVALERALAPALKPRPIET